MYHGIRNVYCIGTRNVVQNKIEKNKRFNFRRQIFSLRKWKKQLNTKFHFQFMLKFRETRKENKICCKSRSDNENSHTQCVCRNGKWQMWLVFGSIWCNVKPKWYRHFNYIENKKRKKKQKWNVVCCNRVIVLMKSERSWFILISYGFLPTSKHRHTYSLLLIRTVRNVQRSSWIDRSNVIYIYYYFKCCVIISIFFHFDSKMVWWKKGQWFNHRQNYYYACV